MAATAVIPSPTVSGIAAKILISFENLGGDQGRHHFSDLMEVDLVDFKSSTDVTIATADQKAYSVVP
ncbi:hypothetical protein [Mesorhizobium caraganae]|uniref:hypothetical protein n=1 Tax=Mesorhizobium caraganae TaxID=483206 RepID=UPI003338CF24